MFSVAISATEAAPTPISATPDPCSAAKAASRRAGLRRFEIIEQRRQPRRHAGREHHRRSQDRAGERPAPDLVHPGHPSARRLFQHEIQHPAAIAGQGPGG